MSYVDLKRLFYDKSQVYTKTQVDSSLNGKQATLVSGTNIKTINNTSLLGGGNISVGGVTVDDVYPIGSVYLSTSSNNPSAEFGGNWQSITTGITGVYGWERITSQIFSDDATTDNSSTLFGNSIPLRNNGANTTSWNSNGYYTIKNTGSQKESMRVLSALTGETGNFIVEYDSYVEGTSGSSGLVIYNSSTSWEKLTDDADSNKKYWYGYNNGSFHETAFYGNTVTNQKWVHYKYTINGSTFSMEVTYNGSTVVTHSETIHLTRDSTTQYGIDSEWQLNTTTRYKNIQAYYI